MASILDDGLPPCPVELVGLVTQIKRRKRKQRQKVKRREANRALEPVDNDESSSASVVSSPQISKKQRAEQSPLEKERVRTPKPSTSALSKYWHQRYQLFSRFDQGVLLDDEGWFSVTPESIAEHIAERCRCDVILDAFAGVGGNAIQFAFTCNLVIAVDIDPRKLECARHNAAIYGVEDRIEFILGDIMTLLPILQQSRMIDVIFLSPPWGGPAYQSVDNFDLRSMIPMDGERLFHAARAVTPNVAYFLPRNAPLDQLASLDRMCEVERNIVMGKVKTVTAYFGDLVQPAGVNSCAHYGQPFREEELECLSPSNRAFVLIQFKM